MRKEDPYLPMMNLLSDIKGKINGGRLLGWAVCGGDWLNEMEIFSECCTQYSGMKCVSLPGEGKRVKGGFVMELQLLIGGADSRWVCLY